MKRIDSIIEAAFRAKPGTRANNNVLWVEVCKALCIEKNITTLDEFYDKILYGEIPSSHTLAARVSIVRKKHPELKPTEAQMEMKLRVRDEYIQEYRNA